MRPTLKTPPADLPVTLAEIKAHCRIEDFDMDDVIAQTYAAAAVGHLDGYSGVLGRCLITQVWDVGFACWSDVLRLPFPDVQSVVVRYVDANGATATVADALLSLAEDARGSFIEFTDDFSAPDLHDGTPFPVQIEATVGYGDADDVPPPLKVAILMLTAHFYANREAVAPGGLAALPLGVAMLVRHYRRVSP